MKTINKSNQLDTLIAFLRGTLPFFDELTPAQRQLLLDSCILRSYAPFESVHTPWERNYGLYLVKAGILQGYAISQQGREFSLFAAGPDENSAFICNAIDIDGTQGGVDFRTLCATELVYIPQESWQQLTEQSLPVCRYSLALVRRTVGVIVRSLQTFMFLPVEKKLIVHLWEKFSLLQTSSPNSLTVTQTHEEIAYILGTSRETVSRALQSLQKQGIVRIGHGKVEILLPNKLHQLVAEIYSQ